MEKKKKEKKKPIGITPGVRRLASTLEPFLP